jgi:6-pyruvoyltetrahydropterin/6-carboxytetrahydropterin synthase
MRLGRRYRFSASHRLHAPRLSAAENAELYGKCNNPFGHGHNYAIEVTVRGPLERDTGRVADPRVLDALVERCVLDAFDLRNLNALPGRPRLDRVRVEETERNIFEIGDTDEET